MITDKTSNFHYTEQKLNHTFDSIRDDNYDR